MRPFRSNPPGSPGNRPSALLRLLAVAPLRRVAAPTIRPVAGAAWPQGKFITGSNVRRAFIIFVSLSLLGIVTVAIALLCGSSGCFTSAAQADIFWQLRLPRALAAFAVGGLLALAGALMQLLLRNPLADPYVLGVSGGAAAGALGMMWLTPAGMAVAGVQLTMHVGALAGALFAVGLLFGLARGALLRLSPMAFGAAPGVRLILTGVMIASGFGALITLILSTAPDAQLRGMVFWLMGDLENSQWYGLAWAVLGLVSVWAVANAARLNVLAHGDATAQLLGVRVVPLRTAAILIASLATAAAVSVAGTIGFVGLVVPHALRLAVGNDQRLLLPASALAGGIALCLADLLARTVIAPIQLPVGVITALIGVPVFLVLLARGRA
ncbi:MAG: iron ABC transporter permease [Burkholderiales bacterium]|nr:iron ABC transporter permease [Burkholderiales bacterium]